MNKKLKSVITGALLGGLILGSVGFVYAASDSSTSGVSGIKSAIKSMMPGGHGHGAEMGQGINLYLATLVKDGVITSEESDAIQIKINALEADRKAEMDKIKAMTDTERKAYFEAKETNSDAAQKPEKIDLLTTLVNENIISSDKADAIRKAMQEQRQEEQQARLTKALAGLVDKGTITSAQSDVILDKLKAQQTERQAEMDKVKAMSETDREAYFKANPPTKDNFLAEMVTAGTISQAQADAVEAAVGEPNGFDKQQEQKSSLTDQLSALVEKGTITSAQSDAVMSELQAQKTARQAEMEKIKAMTETERDAYFKANKTEKTDILAPLVTDGTITQAQADAIEAAIGGPGRGMGHGGMGRGPAENSSTQSDTSN